MEKNISKSIEAHFENMQDPRRETANRRHNFFDILIIAICGSICGADNWVAISIFGKAKEDWFRTFLKLPNGIPSHDTFTDVFAKINPDQFRDCFLSWVNSPAELLPGDIVAIDGKTLRHSYDKKDSRAPVHMVSAWANRNSLVLGQIKTDKKSASFI